MGRNLPTYRFPFAQFPAIRIALCLVTGIVLGSVTKPALHLLLLMFAASTLSILVSGKNSVSGVSVDGGRRATVFYLILVCIFGAFLHHQRHQRDLPRQALSEKLNFLAWETVAFKGRIGEAGLSASGLRNYRLHIEELILEDGVVMLDSFDMRVYSHSEEHDNLKAGNNIGGEIFLYEFPERRNPHEFDFAQWLLNNGFVAQGRIETIHENDHERGTGWQKIRNYALDNIDNRLSESVAPLTKALILGYKNELSIETRNDFSRSGLAHIMAVSGMHVGFVVAPFWLIIPWLWQKKYGKAGGLIFITLLLILYAGLTGFSPSVSRASLMLWLFVYGRLYHKLKESINLAGTAMVILLIIDPFYIYNVGFQLSFGAVFTILLLIPKIQNNIPWRYRNGWRGTIISTMIMSVVVQISLFPILVYYFGEFSIIGPLVNTLVLPLLPVTLPAGFAVSMLGTKYMDQIIVYMAWPVELAFLWIENVAKWFGTGSYSYITIESIPLSLFPLWVVLIGFFASLQVSRARWKMLILVGIVMNVMAAELFVNKMGEGGLEVTYLDVGQGDAIHIKTPGGKHILIDAGRWSPTSNSGKRVLIPYFQSKNIGKLDAVILTHPHADHIGGMSELLMQMDISTVYKNNYSYSSALYIRMKELMRENEVPVRHLHTGDTIGIDPAVRVFVLGPESNGPRDGNPNNHSVALKLVYGETSFLFTGDAEERQERVMAERYEDFLASDVYKAGHHGSNTSSTNLFMSYVNPQLSVASLDLRNRFGHPGTSAVSRIHATGSVQLFTSLEGAVVIQSDGKEIRHIHWK